MTISAKNNLKVHVGFGFHVNCYHSYRGDTNDALGFGGDIRIIRHILDSFDRKNQEGIPAKATWDFENAYSLEEILPRYAPDIIERVRKRQAENGDENILMSYNNGALSSMTDAEFTRSIKWAMTNPYGSGLADLFGSCAPYIRPQEMMLTPHQIKLYNQCGIKGICLYYSCIPFDAFRTLIPQLTDEQAFNPITYTYSGASITIMPTYSPNDIMDAGSLRYLVHDLHDQQQKGKIKHDVFVFINTDADSFLWEPLGVPGFMQKWPCFGGIEGYLNEISDLDFIEFNTVGGYLENHPPLGEMSFGHDLADGNFTGFASWSEKPFNRLIWSRLERARMAARLATNDQESASFETRIRLLSTTHFGLASPVMNISREQKALELSAKTNSLERSALERKFQTNSNDQKALEPKPQTPNPNNTLHIIQPIPTEHIALQVEFDPGYFPKIENLELKADHLVDWTACEMGHHKDQSLASVMLLAKFNQPSKEFHLTFQNNQTAQNQTQNNQTAHTPKEKNQPARFTINWQETEHALQITHQNQLLTNIHSYIDYAQTRHPFEAPTITSLPLAGNAIGQRISGNINLPDQQSPGTYTFDFFETPIFRDKLFCRTSIQYPYTTENREISSQASNLGRFSDTKWREVAPFELKLEVNDQTNILKRDFAGNYSHYPLADFWHAIPENQNIDAFNHHQTAGLLAVTPLAKTPGLFVTTTTNGSANRSEIESQNETGGIALIHARQVLASMAHCPMRLHAKEADKNSSEIKRVLYLNPFGTYYGKQRHYPTRGNGSSMELYLAAAPQARSIAPAYNGAFEQGFQAIVPIKHDTMKNPSDELQKFTQIISDGVSTVPQRNAIVRQFSKDNVQLHEPVKNPVDAKKLKPVSMLTQSGGPLALSGIILRYLKNARRSGKKLTHLQQKNQRSFPEDE